MTKKLFLMGALATLAWCSNLRAADTAPAAAPAPTPAAASAAPTAAAPDAAAAKKADPDINQRVADLEAYVGNGARGSETRDWEFYARTRAAQQFTVAQWSVAPGEDMTKQSAVGGVPGRIGVNPDVFKRLDAKLETLSRAGILSAIVPLLELESERDMASALPDEQAELLLRYIVARWGAEPAAWLLAFDGGDRSQKVERWKRIGQSVFENRNRYNNPYIIAQ